MKGVVKSFSRLKGYGFIQSEELEHEVFVHYTNIDDMVLRQEKGLIK